LPAPIKPVPELLGEVLVELGRPAEAVPFFEQALRRNPNRSSSLLGLARAAAAAERPGAAREQYSALLVNFDHADADLPAVREARAALDEGSVTTTRSHVSLNLVWVALAVIGAIGIALVIRRRARREAAKAPRSRRRAHKKRARSPGP
jgi:hypothetical protein